MSIVSQIFTSIAPLRRKGTICSDMLITDNANEKAVQRCRKLDETQLRAELNAYRANQAARDRTNRHNEQYRRSIEAFTNRARALNERWAMRERKYRVRRGQQLTQRLEKCQRQVLEHETQTREFADMKNRLLYQYPAENRRQQNLIQSQTRTMRRMEFNFYRDIGVQIA